LTTIILSSTAGAVGLLVCIGLILGKRRGWFNTANANGSAPTEATPLVNINNDDNNKKQKQSSSCFGLGLFATLLTAQSKEQSNKAFKV
jgi:hypothetical protein